MKMEVNENVVIRVFNDDAKVFEGSVGQFVEDNEFDEDVIEFVNHLQTNKKIKQAFFSGDWVIEKV